MHKLESSGPIPLNRAMRRRLKRALKMPYTPSVEFAKLYLEKMALAGAVRKEVAGTPIPEHKLASRPAFEDDIVKAIADGS